MPSGSFSTPFGYGAYGYSNDDDLDKLTEFLAGGYPEILDDIVIPKNPNHQVTWADITGYSTDHSADQPEKKQTQTHIRITFNRDLTWSEREALSVFLGGEGVQLKWPNMAVVHLREKYMGGSRDLYDVVALYVGSEFVNLHARAVRTFSEGE